MKPWFEKELAEADIIKFPEPEAKVIQMPNVQEYPDFITGVQDLQAKQKDGTISQDSYDKLYAELIHRFMKKESFETPWYLRENILTEAQQGDRGEASEIFMVCALYLGFKFQKVDKDSLHNFLMYLAEKDNPNISIATNRNENKDKFHLEFTISKALLYPPKLAKKTGVVSWLFDKTNYEFDPKNGDHSAPKAKYKNMLTIASDITMNEYGAVIKELWTNKRPDDVDLHIVGKGGGSIDVKGTVRYPGGPEGGEPIENMQLSLKVGRTHFDQRSGLEFVKSFGEVFGIDTMSIANNTDLNPEGKVWQKYLELREKVAGKKNSAYRHSAKGENAKKLIDKILTKPIHEFYNEVAKKLNAMLKSGKTGEKKERDIMANAAATITTGIFRKEGRVSLLNFADEGYDVLSPNDIDKLASAMETSDLNVKYAPGKRPRLEFQDSKDNKIWFHIRNAIDSHGTIRNFFEQGPKFLEFKRAVAIGSKPDQQKTQPKTTPTTPGAKPQTAPQQKVATGNDGQRYTHYGLQWINQETGRIATRDVAAYLDQNTHLQTPVSA